MMLNQRFVESLNKVLEHKEKFIISTPDLDKLENSEVDMYMMLCIYFCINGPVGLSKKTKYPFLEDEKSVREILGFKVSKRNFEETCFLLRPQLMNSFDVSTSVMLKNFGELWPCERFAAKIKQ